MTYRAVTPLDELTERHGLCHCGCGDPAPIASHTDPKRGRVRGEPLRFIHNHHSRLQRASREYTAQDRGYSTPCWICQSKTRRNGYGVYAYRGRSLLAHRVAWFEKYGEIPPSLYVLHRCDVRECVNPEHLFLGTHADNMRDMVEKGRGPQGVRQHAAKLNDDRVREIRRLHAAGASQYQLARDFGVSQGTIWPLLKGRTWRHVV